jgi:hypothetical protein
VRESGERPLLPVGEHGMRGRMLPAGRDLREPGDEQVLRPRAADGLRIDVLRVRVREPEHVDVPGAGVGRLGLDVRSRDV